MAEAKDNDPESNINFGTKAIDLLNTAAANQQRTFSFEYYPPRTDKGVANLKASLKRMKSWGPAWMDVTWGAGGSTSDLTPSLCSFIQNNITGNSMMHLTCTNMLASKVDTALTIAKKSGLTNILALRGDPPDGAEEWTPTEGGFECALDLVKHIRAHYGDYFGLTVAGYPEGHPLVRKPIAKEVYLANPKAFHAVTENADGSYDGVSDTDWTSELDYLKSKCAAGAEVIITQLFYDAQAFIDWVRACRAHGITAPILPGIMPIRSYGSFKRMTGFCKTLIPRELSETMEAMKEDVKGVYEFGGEWVAKVCEQVLAAKDSEGGWLVPGLHIYTMNTQKCTIELLDRVKGYFVDKVRGQEWSAMVEGELDRVRKEEKMKQMEAIQKKSPVKEGKFTEIESF